MNQPERMPGYLFAHESELTERGDTCFGDEERDKEMERLQMSVRRMAGWRKATGRKVDEEEEEEEKEEREVQGKQVAEDMQ